MQMKTAGVGFGRLRSGLAAMLLTIAVLAAPDCLRAQPASPAPTTVTPAPAKTVAAAPPTSAAPVAIPPSPPAKPAETKAAATTPPTAPPPTAAALQAQINQILAAVAATTDDDKLTALHAQAAQVQIVADRLAAGQSADHAKLAQQIAHLPGGAAGRREAVRKQKKTLTAQLAAVDKLLAQSRQVSANAGKAYAAAAERQRTAFQARLFEHTDSPLSPDFWTSLASAIAPDLDRLGQSGVQAISTAWNAPEPKALVLLAIAVALAVALMLPVRHLLEGLGRRRAGLIAPDKADTDRARTEQAFRLSAYALWMTLVDVTLPAVAATILLLAARWGGTLSSEADNLAQSVVTAVIWGAAVISVGRVLISAGDPDRRLLPIEDDYAKRVRTYPWIVAAITGAGLILTRLNSIIGASVAATVAANCVISIAYAAVAGMFLLALGQGRKPLEETRDAADAARSSVGPLVSLVLAAAIVVSIGGVLAGYTTLSALVSGQVFWFGMLAAATYLLLRFIDDLCTELFSPHGWAARALFRIFNLRLSVIAQLGVLLSAGLSLLVLIGVLSLALTPFGRTGQALFSHVDAIGKPFHIGSISISPTAVAAGLASLAIGVALVHFVQGWLNRRFFPVTDWDAGVRNSVSTGTGYLGIGVAILCAFAIAGLGFQQIALVASALSVGIGFGLQQIVQNFVSGLILLVERPVKVGDWVNLGGQEGDIKNIRVRATEIVTGDKTTLIVPNSDFITKTVQNKTTSGSRGQVQMKITISQVQDALRAKELVLAALGAHPKILRNPGPNVFIEGIEPGAVKFNCTGWVSNPRDAYSVRSDLYFEILNRMLEAKIMFPGGGTPSMVIEAGSTFQDLLAAARVQAPEPSGDGSAA